MFNFGVSSFQSGERGYLEGLASRYADLFNTHYGDVLEHLEDLRRREWEELSPRIRVLVGTTPGTPPSDPYSPSTTGPVRGIVGQHSPQVSKIQFCQAEWGYRSTPSASSSIWVTMTETILKSVPNRGKELLISLIHSVLLALKLYIR
jgi:hypothetical protein